MRLSVLLAFLFAFAANGATTYKVGVQRVGDDPAPFNAATVAVDGANVRADFAGHPTFNRALSHDGGATFIGINDQLKTWFALDHSPFIVRSRYAAGYGPASKARKIKGAGGKWSYTLVTNFSGTSVHMKCTVDLEVEPAAGVPREAWPAPLLFLTGFPEVDQAMSAAVREFPRRIVVTVSRQFEGGPRMTEKTTISVDDIQTAAEVPASYFEKPRDYREQAPVISN